MASYFVFDVGDLVPKPALPNVEAARDIWRDMNKRRKDLRGRSLSAAEFHVCQEMMRTFMFVLQAPEGFSEPSIRIVRRFLGRAAWFAAKTLSNMVRATRTTLAIPDADVNLIDHPLYPRTPIDAPGGPEPPIEFFPYLGELGKLQYQYSNFAIDICGASSRAVILLRALSLRYLNRFEDCLADLRRYKSLSGGKLELEYEKLEEHVASFELPRNSFRHFAGLSCSTSPNVQGVGTMGSPIIIDDGGDDEDQQLQEAIRRSLEDFSPTTTTAVPGPFLRPAPPPPPPPVPPAPSQPPPPHRFARFGRPPGELPTKRKERRRSPHFCRLGTEFYGMLKRPGDEEDLIGVWEDDEEVEEEGSGRGGPEEGDGEEVGEGPEDWRWEELD